MKKPSLPCDGRERTSVGCFLNWGVISWYLRRHVEVGKHVAVRILNRWPPG
ncbi:MULTISPECIES: hypothetical protein [unclassified Akkermansia]|uniref:hypothetical protein n=1 Tax=unclassified Akkermansia TaxID=2608915 RepID=UPI00129A53F7|nr:MULTISPECIES: hypothetical protein [unclassified Akkermansia]